MTNTNFSPSKVTLARANGQAHLDAMKEKNAAIRARAGLEGNRIVKLKPLSEATQAKIDAAVASGRFGRK